MPESFNATFGCMFIAFTVDLICYGAGMLVVFQYFRGNLWSGDSSGVKLMVLSLALLATTHIVTFIAWAYQDLITRFGDLVALDNMPRTALVQLLAIYMVSFISQVFFTSRIYYLTHNWFLAGPVGILALTNIGAGLAQTTLAGKGGTFSNLIHTEKVTSLQSASTAACDMAITVILCWIFHTKRTGIKSTDNLLDNLIILAINRGAITSLAALLNLILFVWRPEAMIFMIPLLPSCQFYVLSVVGSLNYRRNMREKSGSSHEVPLEPLSGSQHNSPAVRVTTSVVTWKDGTRSSDKDSERKYHADPV
ncbi:hypothetical protein IW262DRAFT_884576 [Armillaria fumosa]|nr:hypothetical protein IW262DRAFT_884576 [Armillaria fumosa]